MEQHRFPSNYASTQGKHYAYITNMNSDIGAIIGISLAGSILLVALVFLCLIHLPCCKDALIPIRRRNPRSSTSSQATITSSSDSRTRRNGISSIQALSVGNLPRQNPHHQYYRTGFTNPQWHFQCFQCGNPTSPRGNRSHQCPVQTNQCQYCLHRQTTESCNCSHSPPPLPTAGNVPNTHPNFEYNSPQLLASESPPPYPGLQRSLDPHSVNSSHRSNPPPYSSLKY